MARREQTLVARALRPAAQAFRGGVRGMCAALLLLAVQAAAAQTVFRAAPLGPPEHLLNQEILGGWARAVERLSEGRVKVSMLPRAGPPNAVLDAVRDGSVDVSLLSNSVSSRPLPLNVGLVGFPAAGSRSAEATSVAYQRVVDRFPAFQDEFGGVHLLGVFTHGPGVLLMKGQPFANTVELKGLRLHAAGASAAAAVAALAAVPVMGPGPAAAALFAKGEIDGSITPLDSYVAFGLQGTVNSVLTVAGGFYNTGFSLLMNKAKWDALSGPDQAAIAAASGESLARLAGRAWDNGDRRALEAMKNAGVTLVEAGPKWVDLLQAQGRSREATWIESVGLNSFDASNALADYREELRRLAGEPGAAAHIASGR